MGSDEIDAAGRLLAIHAEDVGGAGKPRRQRAERGLVAAPEAAHVVAVAIVPLQERLGEIAELIAVRTDVPGLGDQHAIGKHRIGQHLPRSPASAREAVLVAAEDRAEIEAEAVDPGLQHEVAHGVEDHAGDRRAVAGERVAAAGVVDEAARIFACMAIVGGIVEAAQRKGRALRCRFRRCG